MRREIRLFRRGRNVQLGNIAPTDAARLRFSPRRRALPQDRETGEFVRGVHVPKLKSNERFRCYKISKRFDQDMSAAMGAFKFTLEGSRLAVARIAFGGMAGTPKRTSKTEAALAGANLADEASWQPALAALAHDFTPITDQRASATYRDDVARALLRKPLIEIGGTATENTRIIGLRETADATS